MRVAEEVFGERYLSACQYVDILRGKGVEWGLLGPREGDRLWERHLLNSVALAELLPQGSTVVDVGSGAGLPGLPLAILRSDLQVTMLEPLLRRALFLTETVADLGLEPRVAVVRARAEDHHQRYDAVVSRAVAPLDRLTGWCAPLRRPEGVILAVKGSSAEVELRTADRELRTRGLVGEVLSVRAHAGAEPATVVRMRSRTR